VPAANSTLPPGIRTAAPKTDADLSKKNDASSIATETHRVQTGDSLSFLAQTYYGDSKYAKFLADANPKLADPNNLKVGTQINIPPLPSDADARIGSATPAGKPGDKAVANANGKRVYTVKSGDSFYTIAKSQLGNASRWKELLAMNHTVVNGDPTALQPGQKLVLPDSR